MRPQFPRKELSIILLCLFARICCTPTSTSPNKSNDQCLLNTNYKRPIIPCQCNKIDNDNDTVKEAVSSSSYPPTSYNAPDKEHCTWQQLPIGVCMTFNASSCIVSTGKCPYNYALKLWEKLQYNHIQYLKILVTNCSDINDIICSPLNREGLLCSRCKPSYGLALYAHNLKCVKCNDKRVGNWIQYWVLELLPLVIFFLLVLTFDIQVATPPYTAYVFYCQIFVQLFRTNNFIQMLFTLNTNKSLLHFTLTLIDVCNLDFFRRILPLFCVSARC